MSGLGTCLALLLWGCQTPDPVDPAVAPRPASNVPDLLRSAGIDPSDVGIDPDELGLLAGRASSRAPLAHLLMVRPLLADALGAAIAGELTRAAREEPSAVFGQLARASRHTIRRGLIGDPLARYREAAAEPLALGAALRACGADLELPASQLAALPQSVQRAATVCLLAARDAVEWIEAARAEVGTEHWERIERDLRRPRDAPRPSPSLAYDRHFKNCVEAFPTELAAAAAQELLFAMAYARDTLRDDPTLAKAGFHVEVDTALGRVVLADSRANQHTYDGPLLLVIDVGGDDSYAQSGANHDFAHPVSLALDLDGDDAYEAPENSVGRFGAGLGGVGILWDDAGDDRYRAGRWALGAGCFGVGMLIDSAGNDAYDAVRNAQGCAIAGFGVLLDREGDDHYHAFTEAQGFAGPNAGAALIDLHGDDRYTANDTDIRFPSSQDPARNNSMAQGMGTGWRADYSDGRSVNGGVAILLDVQGDDEYTCGVFGQGTGYWGGAGLLLDLEGNDRYTGHWYVQGAAAHFAVGVLIDRLGNDRYTANRNMSQGAGHDLSVGVLIEDEGDDEYLASTLGLGASNAGGVGLFIDKAGRDVYRAPPERCLGWVNVPKGLRGALRAFGLFFDLGGETDHYGPRTPDAAARAGPGNDATWTSPGTFAVVDRASAGVRHSHARGAADAACPEGEPRLHAGVGWDR